MPWAARGRALSYLGTYRAVLRGLLLHVGGCLGQLGRSGGGALRASRLHWPQTNRHARHTAGPTCANHACHYHGLQIHSARDSSVLRKVIHASSSCACNHTPHPSHTLYLNTRGRPSEPHRAYRAHHNTHPLHAPAPRTRLNLNAHTYDNTS